MIHKKVITGTGRCGTSFIMQLLSMIGENTGYTSEEAQADINRIDNLNAGIEHGIAWPKTQDSEWIKNPSWINIEQFKQLEAAFKIACVYIPVRNLESTAKSRSYQDKNTHASYGGFTNGAHSIEEQKTINAKLFYNLINYLMNSEIKFRLISFDRMMEDPLYLFHRLELENYKLFKEAYESILDHEKIRF